MKMIDGWNRAGGGASFETMFRFLVGLASAAALAGCGTLRSDLGLHDTSAVQTPVYTANKVLFLEGTAEPRYGALKDGYELAAAAQSHRDKGTRRAIRNRQPLSIVVSRAYLPASIRTCNRRATDALYPKGRDIAVLLDISTSADSQEFIAVWYQRDVPPDELLTFQDLLVYSSDAWDAKYPPYFRLRLVDVSSERNTAVGALLDQVRSSSPAITGLVGVPGAAPIVGIAALAARQVLAHDKNKSLVDFTFQLYGEHLLAEAGGVPLGVLQTGGMIVSAPPCGAGNAFWGQNDLRFDHRLNRIDNGKGSVMAMPYVFATVLTADLSVPQIVRTRSASIMKRLTDPQVVQTELQEAQLDAAKLVNALDALNVRETFRRRPTKEGFTTMVAKVSNNWANLDQTERGFFLDAFYQVSGRSFSDAAQYQAWLQNCAGGAKFDANSSRFEVASDLNGNDATPCWPA